MMSEFTGRDSFLRQDKPARETAGEHTDRNVSKRYEGSGSSRLITAQGVYPLAQKSPDEGLSAKHENTRRGKWASHARLD
jgi:hypothetical protein